MARWSPDPTLSSATAYDPPPAAARDVPAEELAYVSLAATGDVQRDSIAVVDTTPDPRASRLVKVIEREDVIHRAGYVGPHPVVHARHGVMITSEWGTPLTLEHGVSADLLVGGKYGRALHVWDLATRQHEQAIDLGAEQMVLALCPAHNPTRAYGFAGVVLSLNDLSASVFLWYLAREADGRRGAWSARKVITIPASPADPTRLPPLLRERGVVPPLVTHVSLSADDRWLYVSCWGTGELQQYDVTDPFNPVLTGFARLGGIVRRSAHPGSPGTPRNGGPQMTAVSRDGRSVYATNALYTPWDDQFYPDGIRGWMAKVDVNTGGGLTVDPGFLVEFDEGIRPHHVRLNSEVSS